MGRGNKGVIPCICIVTGGEPDRRHKEQVSMTLSQGPTQPSPGIRHSSLMGVMQTHTRGESLSAGVAGVVCSFSETWLPQGQLKQRALY